MKKYSLLLFFILFFIGCTNQPQIGKKAFENEDEFIIKGILAEENNATKAIQIFNDLYKKTDKYVYLEEVIKLNFYKKDYNKTINLVDTFLEKYPNHTEVLKYKIYSYIDQKKLDEALKVAKQFLYKKRDLDTYKLIAYIYIQKKDYYKAIEYLKSAYSISHSPKVLAQMGDIFFKYLNKPNEAISYYQTHIRLYGCEEIICNRLADIYKYVYDYDNLIEIYKKMYNSSGNVEYANKIVYLYIENGKYQKAIEFIKKNKLDDRLLNVVYKARLNETKNYKDAYRLYKATNNNKYFFLYSVYKFEQSKKGMMNLLNVIANLELLVKKDKKPVYLNYLGYILIDYDVNPKKGIEYIKEALKSEPNAPEYLDSLAWGYYKLKQCKKAYDIISKISLNDKEINKHKKLIRRCYDSTKNNKQNKRKSKKRKKHR